MTAFTLSLIRDVNSHPFTMISSSLAAEGATAPPFALASGPGKLESLESYRGRPLVLVFYPADWSPVCGDQLTLYAAVHTEFERLGASLLGISVDSIWCHIAFAEARRLPFPLLSDFEPKGAVSRRYGAYDERTGTSKRALFVIDGVGAIRWTHLSADDVNPGADGILDALERLARNESRKGSEGV